jgi:uncharacterized protein YoxC
MVAMELDYIIISLLTASIVLTITVIVNTLAIIGMSMVLLKFNRQTGRYLELLQKALESLGKQVELSIWRG